MRTSDLCGLVEATSVQGECEDREITAGYTSDLLSDVMAHAGPGSVLVTIQAHRNTVAVASMLDLSAVIICNGRDPAPDMIEAARLERLAIYRTGLSQFEVSGRLWKALNSGARPGR